MYAECVIRDDSAFANRIASWISRVLLDALRISQIIVQRPESNQLMSPLRLQFPWAWINFFLRRKKNGHVLQLLPKVSRVDTSLFSLACRNLFSTAQEKLCYCNYCRNKFSTMDFFLNPEFKTTEVGCNFLGSVYFFLHMVGSDGIPSSWILRVERNSGNAKQIHDERNVEAIYLGFALSEVGVQNLVQPASDFHFTGCCLLP